MFTFFADLLFIFICYFLLCRSCDLKQKQKECSLAQWEGNMTLVAVNPLGQYSLTDSAELSHRGRLLNQNEWMDLYQFFQSKQRREIQP